MKKTALALVAMFPASLALAQTVADMDTDGNGSLSLAELQTVYASLDADGFVAIDANADGAVDDTELKAAVDGGKLTQ